VVTVTVHLLTRRAARVMNCGMARMARLVVPVVTVTVHLLTRRAARVMNCGMARMARLVVPGIPHHVTQRGNGRAPTFFSEGDYRLYLDLLAEHCAGAGVEVWAWVLMPNHTHLVLTPSDEDGLRAALSRTHRRYAGHIHAREKRSGHFWQGRFGCVAMDEAHLAAAICYVALNPVRARLVEHARDWRWSSVHAHLGLVANDGITAAAPVLERFCRATIRMRVARQSR
jgi:putative transposase